MTYFNKTFQLRSNPMKKKRIFIFVVLSTLFFSPVCFAAEPILFFSDIISGPKTGLTDDQVTNQGVIVTVWGKNLGSSQGSSKIYCNGEEAAHVYYWENADPDNGDSGPADLYTYHGMQEIAFSISSAATTGAGKIYVTVNSQDSNELDFTIRDGNIYFVKTSGNGGDNSNSGTWVSPWETVSYDTGGASTKVSAGDIIYVCNGVQEINVDAGDQKDAGIRIDNKDGSAASPFSLIAYPGADVLAKGGNYGIRNTNSEYWVISKYVAIGGTLGDDRGVAIDGFKGGRFVGNELTDREAEVGSSGCADGYNGAIVGSEDKASGLVVFGNYIHDFGCDDTRKFEHTTYFTNRSGEGGAPVIIDSPNIGWNFLKDNGARGGLHFFDENKADADNCGDMSGTLKIHNNVIVNQRGIGIGINTGGPTDPPECFTMQVEIYNNLLINPGKGPVLPGPTNIATAAFQFQGHHNTCSIKLYNNTVLGYGDNSVDVSQRAGNAGLVIGDDFAGTVELVNNVFYDTQDIDFDNIDDTSKITVHSNNLWYNGGDGTPASAPSWDTSPLTGDPKFLDTTSGSEDLTYRSTSPCIDAGLSGVTDIVTTDIHGVSRPQFDKPDIGATEYIKYPPTLGIK